MKQALNNLLFIVFINLSVAKPFKNNVQVKTYNTLQELWDGRWYPGWANAPGGSYSKPSDFFQTLRVLDNDVTGGGVWTGGWTGEEAFFYLDLEQFGVNMKEANLTVKYYYSGNDGISLGPCFKNEDNVCNVSGKKTVKWHTITSQIDLSEGWIFFLSNPPRGNGADPWYIFDQVILSYVE